MSTDPFSRVPSHPSQETEVAQIAEDTTSLPTAKRRRLNDSDRKAAAPADENQSSGDGQVEWRDWSGRVLAANDRQPHLPQDNTYGFVLHHIYGAESGKAMLALLLSNRVNACRVQDRRFLISAAKIRALPPGASLDIRVGREVMEADLEHAAIKDEHAFVSYDKERVSPSDIEDALRLLADISQLSNSILSTLASGLNLPSDELPEATIALLSEDENDVLENVLRQVFGQEIRDRMMDPIVARPFAALPKLKDGLDIVRDHLMNAVEEENAASLPFSAVTSHSDETLENMTFKDWENEFLETSWNRMVDEFEEGGVI